MQRRLPRELRDIIFSCMLEDPWECKITNTITNVWSPTETKYDVVSYSCAAYEYFFNEEYMDYTTTRELTETWYEKQRNLSRTTSS
jgi:hypothetical protein